MRGSEKINPSKFIKEATLELTLWGGFFVVFSTLANIWRTYVSKKPVRSILTSLFL